MILAVIHAFKLTVWEKIFLYNTFVHGFCTLSFVCCTGFRNLQKSLIILSFKGKKWNNFLLLLLFYIWNYAERKKSLLLLCSWWNTTINIWLGWHVWKIWLMIKFHFHMRPFQQKKKWIRYYLGKKKKPRGDRELKTYSHCVCFGYDSC